MKRAKLIAARYDQGLSQEEVAEHVEVSRVTVSQWERGKTNPHPFHVHRLTKLFGKTAEELDISVTSDIIEVQGVNSVYQDTDERRNTTEILTISLPAYLDEDLLTIYARGIAACQDLHYKGNPYQIEAILPLYAYQTTRLAQQPGILQRSAARLASQACQLACELATDRENFGTARQAGQQALMYAQVAEDTNLQVNALIGLANLGWHLSFAQPYYIRRHSKDALHTYEQAVALLENVTPLLKGRTYAGIAEVYAMRGQFQEAMGAMGLAYEHFPMKPEDDPAYPYLRSSRYALYVFGDAQSRLLLHQPKEAERALIAMQKETNDPEVEPITKVDLLYYRAEAQIQQGEIEPSIAILIEAATLAKSLGSRLYFNKLAASYYRLEEQWPKERSVTTSEEMFRPW